MRRRRRARRSRDWSRPSSCGVSACGRPAGRVFADVVIGVPFDAAVGQGHAAADAVERALESALPEADVVVHVEPMESDAAVRERALAAALGVPRVREVHNVSVARGRLGKRALAAPEAPGRSVARRGARGCRAGRARDPRGGARDLRGADAPRAARRGDAGQAAAAADVATDRETVARIVREPPARSRRICASSAPTRGSSSISRSARRRHGARRRACAGERDRGDDPRASVPRSPT